jgi:hypothetical protein
MHPSVDGNGRVIGFDHETGTDGNGRVIRVFYEINIAPLIQYHDETKTTIDRRFYLFSVYEDTRITHQQLLDALRAIDSAICPHLRTSSQYLSLGRELTAACLRGWHGIREGTTSKRPRRPLLKEFRRCDTECLFWSKCPNEECDTWFSLVDTTLTTTQPTMLSWRSDAISSEMPVIHRGGPRSDPWNMEWKPL